MNFLLQRMVANAGAKLLKAGNCLYAGRTAVKLGLL